MAIRATPIMKAVAELLRCAGNETEYDTVESRRCIYIRNKRLLLRFNDEVTVAGTYTFQTFSGSQRFVKTSFTVDLTAPDSLDVLVAKVAEFLHPFV
jgi:hypothetical protein